MTLSLSALDCFVKNEQGVWVCVKDATVPDRREGLPIPVKKGMEFFGRTIFASYDDFTGFLDRIAIPITVAKEAA